MDESTAQPHSETNGEPEMDAKVAVEGFKIEIERLGLNYEGPGVDDILMRFATYLKDCGLLDASRSGEDERGEKKID